MARRLRVSSGGIVYHVLNRLVGRQEMFSEAGDYAAFENGNGRRVAGWNLLPAAAPRGQLALSRGGVGAEESVFCAHEDFFQDRPEGVADRIDLAVGQLSEKWQGDGSR